MSIRDPLINDKKRRSASPVLNFFNTCCGCICCIITFVITVAICFGIVLAIFSGLALRYFYSVKANLNIHIKLDPTEDCYAKAVDYNTILEEKDKNEWLNFMPGSNETNEPHITLYLSDFYLYRLFYIFSEINDIAEGFNESCTINFPSELQNNNGTYLLWNSDIPDCLQSLCDNIVTATSEYLHKDAKTHIPEWVKKLPEKERKIKEEMIEEYGSPNVFTQYSPHITVGIDEITPNVQYEIAKKIKPTTCKTTVKEISVSRGLNYGQIKKGDELFNVAVNAKTN